MEGTSSSVISRSTNYHTNYPLFHDHNYAALPPTSTAAYFGSKNIRQKNSSQCGASGGSTSSTPPACCSRNSSTNCCYGILTTTLTSSSPTSTKFQLNLQLNVLKCEVERLNDKCMKQSSVLEKLKEEISLKTRQLSEQLEELNEKENRLVEEINQKTELQDKFSKFRGTVTKLSCGVILLIGELKRNYLNCGADGTPVKKNGFVNGKVESANGGSEDNDKLKLINELDRISELVQDNLRAWVSVDQVIGEEDVRMMRERLSGNREDSEEGDEEGDGKEVQVVVAEVEVVEEEKENLSVVSEEDGNGEEEEEVESTDKWGPEEDGDQEEVLESNSEDMTADASVAVVEQKKKDKSGKEDDLKVGEDSSHQSRSEKGGQAVSKGRKNKEPVKFRCSMCPSLSLRFEEMDDLKEHFKEVHQNQQWSNARGCKRCGMVFVGIGLLHKHRFTEQ